ncbi:MAG: hypothetical protein M1133_07610 [Armatimonadetes bacterium]|nr:hypothetical protein [Armatimonadota bacterium]
MRDNTYPDPRVSRLINQSTVPVQFNIVEDPGAMLRYHSFWTPTMMLQDADGVEYRRSYGALSPEAFLAEFSLGKALRYLHSGNFRKAIDLLEHARNYTAVHPERNAENHYWLAVGKYRATDDPAELEHGWQELRAKHPSSDWARKTDFSFAD